MCSPASWMELPDHFPIDVDSEGRGPAFGDDIAKTVCWCGNDTCTKYTREEQ